MGLLNRIKMLWRAAVGASYSWPALDITLPGERYLHLVGIHMGTRDMSPPPARLLKKIRQADALIVEADITGNETPFTMTSACPPLAERLTPQQLVELESRAAGTGCRRRRLTASRSGRWRWCYRQRRLRSWGGTCGSTLTTSC